MNKKRNPFLVVLLSLACPGLGHVYLAEFRKGATYNVTILLLSLGAFLCFRHTFYGGLVFVVFVLVVYIKCIINAFRLGRRPEGIILKPYNQWYIYLLLYICLNCITQVIPYGAGVQPFKFTSTSMEPTIQQGDLVMTDAAYYRHHKLSRGDLVAFTLPDSVYTPDVDDSKIVIVKRIIGLPGEKVEVEGPSVLINDVALEESYSIWRFGGVRDFGPEVVPPGKVFLLGDNRDQSRDSRYWPDHFLPVNRLKGRLLYIYWTWHWDRIKRIGQKIQ